jgi:hypothetical protein
MGTPTFDSRITLGNILTIIGLLISVAVGYADLKSETRLLAQRLGGVEAKANQRENDHDILIRIETQLAEMRSVIERRSEK